MPTTSLGSPDRAVIVAAVDPDLARLEAFASKWRARAARGAPTVAVCNTLWYRPYEYFTVPWRGKCEIEGGGPALGHDIHQMAKGYLPLRDRVRAGDFTALDDLHRAAAGLVQDLVPGWRELWRRRPLAHAAATGDHLAALGAGQAGHLAAAAVEKADGPVPKYGMCGHLTTWQLH